MSEGEATGAADRLAQAIADGDEIDWEREETSADPALVGAMRDLERLVTAHRDLHRDDEEPQDPTPALLEAGDSWGRLEILELLGSGGFADVYRARETQIRREAALKILRGAHDENSGSEDLDEQLREAQLLARLKHPNVVTVYGADCHNGRVGLWMELLEGRNLFELVDEDGPLSAREAALVGMDLCSALAAVHESGIVHRDVKAQNVIRERGGRIVLMDFGIGVDVLGGARGAGPTGTPVYLAPELLVGGEASERSDVYALGVLLFFLVSGEFPVRGRNLEELRRAHDGSPRLLRDLRSDLPESFLRALETAMAAEPVDRFATPGAFQRRLAESLRPESLGPESLRPESLRTDAERQEDDDADPVTKAAGGLPPLVFSRPALFAVLALALVAAWLVVAFGPSMSAPPEPRSLLVAGLDDRTEDGRFRGLLEPALRAAVEAEPAFAAVAESEVKAALERMLVADDERDRALADEARARDAAARVGAAGILRGELLALPAAAGSPDLELRLRLVAAGEDGPRWLSVQPVAGRGAVAVDRALEAALGELAELAPALDPVVALAPVTTDSHAALEVFSDSLRRYRAGEIESPCDGFSRALELDPELAVAHFRLALCRGAQGQAQEAFDRFLRAWELRDRVRTPLERQLLEGGYYAGTRRYRPAIDAYRKVLEEHPDDELALRQIVHAYRGLKRMDDAVIYARRARYTGSEMNYGILVHTLALAGLFEEALAEAEAARQRFGQFPYLYWGEGLALLGLDRFDEALTTFRAFGEVESGTYRNVALWLEAQAWIYAGDYDRALELLYEGERHDATSGTQYLQIRRAWWRAETLRLQGRHREASMALEVVGTLPSLPSHLTIFRSAAVLCVRIGDVERARGLLRRLEELYERYPGLVAERVVRQVRAEVLAAEGDLEAAAAELARGEALADVSYLASMARLDVRRGDCRSALVHDRHALERKGEILAEDFAGLWHEAKDRSLRCRQALAANL